MPFYQFLTGSTGNRRKVFNISKIKGTSHEITKLNTPKKPKNAITRINFFTSHWPNLDGALAKFRWGIAPLGPMRVTPLFVWYSN